MLVIGSFSIFYTVYQGTPRNHVGDYLVFEIRYEGVNFFLATVTGRWSRAFGPEAFLRRTAALRVLWGLRCRLQVEHEARSTESPEL